MVPAEGERITQDQRIALAVELGIDTKYLANPERAIGQDLKEVAEKLANGFGDPKYFPPTVIEIDGEIEYKRTSPSKDTDHDKIDFVNFPRSEDLIVVYKTNEGMPQTFGTNDYVKAVASAEPGITPPKLNIVPKALGSWQNRIVYDTHSEHAVDNGTALIGALDMLLTLRTKAASIRARGQEIGAVSQGPQPRRSR